MIFILNFPPPHFLTAQMIFILDFPPPHFMIDLDKYSFKKLASYSI